MDFTPDFFAFQLKFARLVAERIGLSFPDALYHYTTLSKTLGTHVWDEYSTQLIQASDPAAWTYRWYLDHRTRDLKPDASSFSGHPLFGCFYYLVREHHIIRIHFIKNDPGSPRPLSRERMRERQAEVGRMFAHIQRHSPSADTVLGNSWLYNLDAYRRLFPPAYTAAMPMSVAAEFQFLAFWGQCFDHAWNPKPLIVRSVLRNLAHVTRADELRWCFPFQILQPRCAITAFYSYYSIH